MNAVALRERTSSHSYQKDRPGRPQHMRKEHPHGDEDRSEEMNCCSPSGHYQLHKEAFHGTSPTTIRQSCTCPTLLTGNPCLALPVKLTVCGFQQLYMDHRFASARCSLGIIGTICQGCCSLDWVWNHWIDKGVDTPEQSRRAFQFAC